MPAMTEPLTAFKALADPARLQIVEFLQRPDTQCCAFSDKVCACDVEKFLGLSQPAVSHHMRILIQSGLVTAEKSGRWTFYRIDPAAFDALARFCGALGAGAGPRRAARSA
jgi:ArsR family transcriptional regulator